MGYIIGYIIVSPSFWELDEGKELREELLK
jgi:hypothetical protein